MSSYLNEFKPPRRILMGPGPSDVHSRVLQAMTMPILGHLDPDFLGVMDDVMEMLRIVFKTSNKLTLPLSATGSAGMEAAFCNMVEPGDTVVVGINGYFGHRMADIASRCGADLHTVEFPWGRPIGPDLSPLEQEMKKHRSVKALGVVHGETSTGVLSPLPSIAELAHRYDALLIADAVTSLGGEEVTLDEWDVDVSYSASQKCLGAPPGLSPITLGPRAVSILKERKTRVQSFYLNLADLESYWSEGQARVYHHTAPISMIYALREALRMAMEEGMEERIRRHGRNATALRAGLEALGLELFADPQHRLNPLTTVVVPEGVNEARVRRRLLADYGIEIGGGLGEIAGRVWRVGLMGESSRESNVLAFLSALERTLPEEGYEVAQGAGVAGAQRALAFA
jgi:alanine-glyoxylate transaminase/serine-glyoxylate transaminase/serine-pyruvate transaminase